MVSVTWSRQATADLARLCLDNPGRWADMDAAEQDISGKLGRQPLQHSQEVSEGLRRIISWPLVAYFFMVGNRIVVDAVGWIG